MSRGRMTGHEPMTEMDAIDYPMTKNKNSSGSSGNDNGNDSFYIWGFFLVLAMLYVGYLCGIL